MDIVKEFIRSIPQDRATEEALYRVISKKKVRDFLIIKDFDSLIKKGKTKIIDAYYELGEKYEISHNLVRLIISQRKSNQI